MRSQHYKIAWKRGFLAIVMASAAGLSGCDDDDDSAYAISKSIEYNASLPLLPEGLAYDSIREAFLVSSASTGTIGQVDKSGNFAALIPATTFAGNGSFGLEVDATHNRLHVVSSNLQDPTYAHLLTFDLSSMMLLSDIDLAVLNGGLSFINDVAVDPDGNAYVTNSDQGIVYKVDLSGNATIFFQDANLSPADPATETGLNGIAYHSDGFLVLAHFATSKLYKLSLEDTPVVSEISLPAGRVIEPDGIEINGDKLYTVNSGSTGGFISQFSMNNDWSAGTISGDAFPTGSIFPTALAKTDDGLFVNNSYFNFPAYSNNPTQYLISQASFDQSTRYSGTASEIPRLNTPVIPLGYGSDYPAAYLAGCSEPLATGIPDLQGDWIETDVTIAGVNYPAASQSLHKERIEQCGNRIVIVSGGVVHDVYQADGTLYNGVNDINPQGQPIHSTGIFTADGLVLTPVLPTSLNMTIPDVTRELISDDANQSVLRFFNAGLGRVVYLTHQSY